jgi:phosphoribosylformimino-5-aminoimidazole carboxamide ribotide isomerase
MADAGLTLMLDAGVGDLQRALAVAQAPLHRHRLASIVVALESLEQAGQLPTIFEAVGAERAVFSLDLYQGRPVARTVSLQQRAPIELADLAWQVGFRQLIVLDIAAVGTGQGPVTVELCRRLAARHAWHELMSGGGVRGKQDLLALSNAGCHAALVASALPRWTT